MLYLKAGRLEKHLGNVAVPEMVAALVGLRKNVNLSKLAAKTETEKLRRPQQADFGFPLRVGVLPLPIRAEHNRPGLFPIAGSRESLFIQRGPQPRGDHLGVALTAIGSRIHVPVSLHRARSI